MEPQANPATTYNARTAPVFERLRTVAEYLATISQSATEGLIWRDEDGRFHFLSSVSGLVIGRSNGLPQEVPDRTMSRQHFRLEGAELTDLGSSNGTWVNDRRREALALVHGDVVRAGRQIFVFREKR